MNYQSVKKERYYNYSYRVLCKENQAQQSKKQGPDHWKSKI